MLAWDGITVIAGFTNRISEDLVVIGRGFEPLTSSVSGLLRVAQPADQRKRVHCVVGSSPPMYGHERARAWTFSAPLG